MKLEEKIKDKYLYSYGLNIFKFLYFNFQFFKAKFKPRIINANWALDLIVDNIFRKKKGGIYIDVGCHHPFINNNTYLLYKKGWKGINIDLDFSSIDMFNYFRPEDDNRKIGISNKKGFSNLYFFHNRAAKNTLFKKSGRGAKQIKKIEIDTLNNIIKNSKFKIKEIDFLTIDVEGNELNVLKGLDFKKYKPKLVALEFINPNNRFFYQQKIEDIQKSKVFKFMTNKGYKLSNWIHDDLLFTHKSFLKIK